MSAISTCSAEYVDHPHDGGVERWPDLIQRAEDVGLGPQIGIPESLVGPLAALCEGLVATIRVHLTARRTDPLT